jgi:hypothetical protein
MCEVAMSGVGGNCSCVVTCDGKLEELSDHQ